MNLIDLDTFVRVAEHGSFTKAARHLRVPKSTVSRRVARLEDELGLALVQRSGRSIALTELGRQLHLRSAPALRELDEAERAVREADSGPSGLLRITAPADLGTSRAVTELFVGYRKRYPSVRLDVYLSDRIVDLVGEGFDLALRPSSSRSTWGSGGLMSRSLGHLEAAIYASTAWLHDGPLPSNPAELGEQNWIAHRAWVQGGLHLVHREQGTQVSLDIEPVMVTNHIDQVIEVLIAAGGIGAVPRFLARPFVERGQLVRLFEDWDLPGGTLAAVWPETRHMSPKLRAFLDFAAQTLQVC